MTKIGYQRVSTTDQNTDRQELDVDRVFEDKASGKDADRPALKEMLAYIRGGDEVVVFSIDRLARNLRDLEDIIKEINAKDVSVTFLSENLTFSGRDDAMSTLMLQMMGSFAQFERSMILKRQAEGIAAAKAKRHTEPPPLKWSAPIVRKADPIVRKAEDQRWRLRDPCTVLT
ncbi:MAG: recombinase family protein [Paracoccaceae bacterium]|nr:recombinase family protein [Paracoccaceae bacterium]